MSMVSSLKDIIDLQPMLGTAPVEGVRFAPHKISRAEFEALFPFSIEPCEYYENGYRLMTTAPGKGKIALHLAGACYYQEPSAMSAITALQVQRGDRVLDLCAAPGSKATALAAQCGEGFLVANEIHPARARILLSNVERMGISNTLVTQATPAQLREKLVGVFDKILVDSPCSGEGMFRKEPEVLRQWSPQLVEHCANRSAEILDAAADMLRPGGRMVYSTCTFNTMENEETILSFLKRHPDFEVVPSGILGAERGLCGLSMAARLFPSTRGEGHFVCAMVRRGDEPPRTMEGYAPQKQNNDFWQCIYDCVERPQDIFYGVMPVGVMGTDCMWLVPPSLPRVEGIHILRAGIMAAARKGKTILPCHHLFTATPPDAFCRVHRVNDTLAEAFLHGEQIEGQSKGYTAILWNGLSLGFAKGSGGVLKNHYPKGLRV